jgi:hypothetical protein
MEAEMERDSAPQWAIALGAVVVAMLVASIGLVAAGGWAWFSRFLESAAPAWVQAIGSIAAIAAAAWLARDDRRVRRMDARVAAELMLTRAEATLVHAISAITPVANHLLDGPMVQSPQALTSWRSMEASVDLPSQADLQVLYRSAGAWRMGSSEPSVRSTLRGLRSSTPHRSVRWVPSS